MKARRFLFRAPTIFGTPLKYGAPVFIGFTVIVSGLSDALAGDILRGGSPAARPKASRSAAAADTPDATDAARANAKDTLARTTRTLDAWRFCDLVQSNRSDALELVGYVDWWWSSTPW